MHTTLPQNENKPGRKLRPEERVSVQMRLRPSIYAKVKQISKAHGVSIAYVTERCIEAFEGLK